MEDYHQILQQSLNGIFKSAVEMLPIIILSILGLLLAWLIIKILLFILRKILKAFKVDLLSNRINDAKLFGDSDFKIDLLKIIIISSKFLLILIFTSIIAQVLKLDTITDGIGAMFAYLPTLLSAILVGVGGLYLALQVKKAVGVLLESMGVGGSKFISNTLFYTIAFFVSITALNQAGIGTDIITNNITLVLGGFLAAIAIGFGLGSRSVFQDVLRTFYARKNFMVGDRIELNNLKGTIVAIENISVTLKTEEGRVVIPIKELVNSRVYHHTQEEN